MIERSRNSGPEDRIDSYCEPPIVVQFSMILDRGLTKAEKSKLKRLEARISAMFMAAGATIRLCESSGEGDQRKIGFVPGLIGSPLVSLSANHFLAASDDELLREFESSIEKLSKGR
jgi:hypothetical protein